MRSRTWAPLLLAAAACLAARLPGLRAETTSANGTFRFLTKSLPSGSTNAEYVARLVTANADGPVTYGVAQGSSLPPGMEIDGKTGYVTGRPTSTANTSVTFTAADGTDAISFPVTLHVNASGGGGNGGSTFSGAAFPEGRLGAAYAHTVTLTGGVGPYVFGAVSLPPGLTLDGLTGSIAGTPSAAGTYFVGLSVVDKGESNNVVTVQPLTVLPASSDFRFTTSVLGNGEVGTPFCDAYATSGGSGTVTFAASGLPPGLAVDAATGIVSGTPTTAGTFQPLLTATDAGGTISTNLSMIVAPSPASSFYWNFSGVPAAIAGTSYTRQPPILVAAQNGSNVAYAAVGLPAGIAYGAASGELSGTATEVGEYPVTFTATDAAGGAVLVLAVDFVVLPPNGGDAGDIAVNLWQTKETLRAGTPGRDLWTGTCLYNADRRTGAAFDRAVDGVAIGVGSRTIVVAPGAMAGTPRLAMYRSPKGEVPAVQVRVSQATQVVQWTSRSDTLTETLPATARVTVAVGRRGFRLDEFLDASGVFRAPSGLRRTAFVVASGKVRATGVAAKDTATLSMLLADPAFAFVPGTSALRVRLLHGANVLVDRDFTALGAASTATDPRTHLVSTTVKSLKDAAPADRVARFVYSTRTGKMTLSLAALTIPGLTAQEAHLGVEITIGTRVAYTAVTFFAPVAGRYSTRM